jgi:hypothetical protein
MQKPELVHASAVSVGVDFDGPLAGALLSGPSGIGKSSVALALIAHCPFRRTALIADDAVLLENIGGRLVARMPETIKGLIEIRGFGPARVRSAPSTLLTGAFELAESPPRLPEPRQRAFAGAGIPAWTLAPGDPAIVACRIRVILRAFLARNDGFADRARPPRENS